MFVISTSIFFPDLARSGIVFGMLIAGLIEGLWPLNCEKNPLKIYIYDNCDVCMFVEIFMLPEKITIFCKVVKLALITKNLALADEKSSLTHV